MAEDAGGPIVILYGVVIHDAIRSGDVERMRQVESDAQRYVDSVDEVKSALSDLSAEIRRRADS
jgi:iron uptake system EfeUOB component EfeO/EfeM